MVIYPCPALTFNGGHIFKTCHTASHWHPSLSSPCVLVFLHHNATQQQHLVSQCFCNRTHWLRFAVCEYQNITVSPVSAFFIIITITSISLIQLMCQLGNNWKQFPCIFMTLQRILLSSSPSSSSSIIIIIILILSDSSSLTATNSWTSVSLLVTMRGHRHRWIGAF